MITNSLTLAYLGDGIYELLVRDHLVKQGIVKVNDLQKSAVLYVSARAQCMFLKRILEDNLLTLEEEQVVMRARNHKGTSHPKNTDIITYKYATGLESLFGYLYLKADWERIHFLMKKIWEDYGC